MGPMLMKHIQVNLGSDKGLAYALSFMALELIFSRIAPQKTKCSVSLVYHVVDVVDPLHILLYGCLLYTSDAADER